MRYALLLPLQGVLQVKTYTIEAEVTYLQTFTVEAEDDLEAYERGMSLAQTEGSAGAVIIDEPRVTVLSEA